MAEVIHSLWEKEGIPHEPTRNIHIHPKAIPHPSRHHQQIRIPRHHLQKPKNCRTLCHLLPINRKNNFHGSSGRAGHDRQLHRNIHLAPAKYMDKKHWLAVPLDGAVSDSKVLDLLDMSYDLVDGPEEADGEIRTDRQTGTDGQTTDSTTEEKDWQFYLHIP